MTETQREWAAIIVVKAILIVFSLACIMAIYFFLKWMNLPPFIFKAILVYLVIDLALITSGISEHGLWFWQNK